MYDVTLISVLRGPSNTYMHQHLALANGTFNLVCVCSFSGTLIPGPSVKAPIHDATLLHATFACNKVASCMGGLYTRRQVPLYSDM